jgi:STE24 endopeptidase
VFVALFLILFAVECAIELGLNELNLRHVRARAADGRIPAVFEGKISSADYDRSVAYTLAKGRFQRWAEIYGRLVTLLALFSGVLPFLDNASATVAASLGPHRYAQGIIWCVGVTLLFSVVRVPTDLYARFGIEARFGFNRMTVPLYVADTLKALVIGLVIGVPVLSIVLWLMDATGRHWWIWAGLVLSALQLLMVVVYPTLIAPLFNTFVPLNAGELRDRILRLADQVGFETSGIYSMDGSRRSAHSNAYFTGIGKAKRIVLFDTLIDQMTVAQGLAVLAHEMGHYKLKHIRRMLAVQACALWVGLYVLSVARDYPPLFAAFGFDHPSNHVALILCGLLAGPFTFYLGPLVNRLSRKHEYEADRFAAATLRDGHAMEEALVNLTVKNLSNLTPHPWYSAYHYSHPTPGERIGALRQGGA